MSVAVLTLATLAPSVAMAPLSFTINIASSREVA